VPRVVGIDPGTVSIDLCGLDNGVVWLDRTLQTRDALQDPTALVDLLTSGGRPDLVAGPSGYGLPLVRADQATDADFRLALLASDDSAGGIGGLRSLMRAFASSGLPVLYTPGVMHLPSVPVHRKYNRVDLGTADKVATAALGIWDQTERLGCSVRDTSFILLELGGAFTAALAVERGAIVDGIGGTSGPMGWQSAGAWDGEVAFLAGRVTKGMLFRGGHAGTSEGVPGVPLDGYIEGAHKAVLSLLAPLPSPREILLSGRHALDGEVRKLLEPRLATLAPVHHLAGFAATAKQGAQGAALIADGLAGGEHRELVATLRLREAAGTVLDYLRVITPADARRQLGIR
jgi:predicted butyrate kinase (DUF1464 family)